MCGRPLFGRAFKANPQRQKPQAKHKYAKPSFNPTMEVKNRSYEYECE